VSQRSTWTRYPRVGAALRDQGLAFLGDQRIVLVAAEDDVDVGGGGEALVLRHLLMSDATTTRAPRVRRRAAASLPATSGGLNTISGPGREVRAVSAIVRPKTPTSRPPSVSNSSVEAPPNGRPERRSTTFADSQ